MEVSKNLIGVDSKHYRIKNQLIFFEILESDVNLVLVKRNLSHIADTIEEIVKSDFQKFQIAFERGDDLDLIGAELDEILALKAESAYFFYKDIIELAEHFLKVCKDRFIGIRLETVSTDSCQLFHIDWLGLRLVSTYSGLGTEWLKNEDVQREGLGQGDDSLVLKAGAKIEQLSPFDLALMKGERFLRNQGNGLVHRSPRIVAKGEKRLLLRIDTLDEYGLMGTTRTFFGEQSSVGH